jgi:hypothetical protein
MNNKDGTRVMYPSNSSCLREFDDLSGTLSIHMCALVTRAVSVGPLQRVARPFDTVGCEF